MYRESEVSPQRGLFTRRPETGSRGHDGSRQVRSERNQWLLSRECDVSGRLWVDKVSGVIASIKPCLSLHYSLHAVVAGIQSCDTIGLEMVTYIYVRWKADEGASLI